MSAILEAACKHPGLLELIQILFEGYAFSIYYLLVWRLWTGLLPLV